MVLEEHRKNRWVVANRSQQAPYPFRRSDGTPVDPPSHTQRQETATVEESREAALNRLAPVLPNQQQQPTQQATQQIRPRVKAKARGIVWAYGVTTVPSRRETTLPQTLKSLQLAGFDSPRLFIDGAANQDVQAYGHLGLEITSRHPAVRAYGNWVLTLWELYLRDPSATRYAIFQDDCITYHNLREFLDQQEYPEKGYWNLYSFSDNEPIIAKSGQQGWVKAGNVKGHSELQTGRGAVGLVLSRDAAKVVLSAKSIVEKPQDQHYGWRRLDGAIVTAMNAAGWTEYIHNPSLVQHIGYPSTISGVKHRQAQTFKGETFDALELLK